MNRRYIALIPAYRPENKLLALTDELKCKGFDIVVVDDGSGSEYKEVFEAVSGKAKVLTHDVNKGKGAALKTGLKYINEYMSYRETVLTEEGEVRRFGKSSVVVTADADGQHLSDDILRVAAIASARPDALVLGSRALAEDVPLRSRIGNTVTRHVYAAATGVHIHDTQTGLRAFSIKMIPHMLEIEGDRYEYETNMLLKLASEGVPIIEEEIETVYDDNNSSSHFNTIKDSFRIYKEIIKFAASSLTSFAIDYIMYAILIAATGITGISQSIIVSNIGARIVSGTVNYTLNRKMVFKSRTGFAKSAAQYAVLAALILAGNTAVLSMLTGTFGVGKYAAKLITEIIFFTVSWIVQKYVIFYSAESSEGSGKEISKDMPEKREDLLVKVSGTAAEVKG